MTKPFDPDKFLQESTSFDPDAFLAQDEKPEADALDYVQKALSGNLLVDEQVAGLSRALLPEFLSGGRDTAAFELPKEELERIRQQRQFTPTQEDYLDKAEGSKFFPQAQEKTFGDEYYKGARQARAASQRATEESPVGATALEIAAGLTSPLGLAGRGVKTVKGMMGVGAGLGATAGAVKNEAELFAKDKDFAEELGKVGTGAALGLGLGAAAGGAIPAIGKAASYTGNKAVAAKNALAEKFPKLGSILDTYSYAAKGTKVLGPKAAKGRLQASKAIADEMATELGKINKQASKKIGRILTSSLSDQGVPTKQAFQKIQKKLDVLKKTWTGDEAKSAIASVEDMLNNFKQIVRPAKPVLKTSEALEEYNKAISREMSKVSNQGEMLTPLAPKIDEQLGVITGGVKRAADDTIDPVADALDKYNKAISREMAKVSNQGENLSALTPKIDKNLGIVTGGLRRTADESKDIIKDLQVKIPKTKSGDLDIDQAMLDYERRAAKELAKITNQADTTLPEVLPGQVDEFSGVVSGGLRRSIDDVEDIIRDIQIPIKAQQTESNIKDIQVLIKQGQTEPVRDYIKKLSRGQVYDIKKNLDAMPDDKQTRAIVSQIAPFIEEVLDIGLDPKLASMLQNARKTMSGFEALRDSNKLGGLLSTRKPAPEQISQVYDEELLKAGKSLLESTKTPEKMIATEDLLANIRKLSPKLEQSVQPKITDIARQERAANIGTSDVNVGQGLVGMVVGAGTRVVNVVSELAGTATHKLVNAAKAVKLPELSNELLTISKQPNPAVRAYLLDILLRENPQYVEELDAVSIEQASPIPYGNSIHKMEKQEAERSPASAGPLTTKELPNFNVDRAANYAQKLVDMGFTPVQAAALMGNAAHESYGFNKLEEMEPNAYGTKGLGWMQWTDIGKPGMNRRSEFEQYARQQGLDPMSEEANLGFLLKDLKSNHWTNKIGGRRAFAEVEDPDLASDLIMKDFLRPHQDKAKADQRRQLTREVLKRIKSRNKDIAKTEVM